MLDLAIRADNAGADAIGDLTLRHHDRLGGPLAHGVRDVAHRGAQTADLRRHAPEKDAVEAEGTRRFRTSVDLSTIGGISRTDSLVYPMRIDLRTAGVQVAVIDTAVIFVVRTPEVPLLVSTTIGADRTPALDPDGRLVDTAFQASHRAGWLPVGAGDRARPAGERNPGQPHRPGDQPSLLDQLSRMADGVRTRRRQHRGRRARTVPPAPPPSSPSSVTWSPRRSSTSRRCRSPRRRSRR